jgi:subtilase family serine protease
MGCKIVAVYGLLGGLVFAVPSQVSAAVDLEGTTITVKAKCTSDTCKIKNATLLVQNNGDEDTSNSRVAFYLSDDIILTTVTDTLLHESSLGKVKVGKAKKRTLGGGHIKKAGPVSGKYIIAVVDSTDVLAETNELNNNFTSEPLP